MIVFSPAVIGSPKTLLTFAAVARFSCNDCNKVKLLIIDSSVGIHPFRIHAMERVHSRFLLDAVTPVLVAPRVQIFLYRLADCHVLDLNLMAEFHGRLRRSTA